MTLSLLHHEYEAECRANHKIPYSYRLNQNLTFHLGEYTIPYLTKITAIADNFNYGGLYDFGNAGKGVAGWQIDNQVPFLGKLISAPFPTSGTQNVLVYVSTTGADYSWHRRALFTIYPDNSIKWSYTYVN